MPDFQAPLLSQAYPSHRHILLCSELPAYLHQSMDNRIRASVPWMEMGGIQELCALWMYCLYLEKFFLSSYLKSCLAFTYRLSLHQERLKCLPFIQKTCSISSNTLNTFGFNTLKPDSLQSHNSTISLLQKKQTNQNQKSYHDVIQHKETNTANTLEK